MTSCREPTRFAAIAIRREEVFGKLPRARSMAVF
jgi:hypothetical protein